MVTGFVQTTICFALLTVASCLDVTTTDGVLVTNSTTVVRIGEVLSLHCSNDSAVWEFQSGSPVPSSGPVQQISNGTSRTLVFSVGFDRNHQGFYKCVMKSPLVYVYVGVFISSNLAPTSLTLKLQSFPMGVLTWADPGVGPEPVDSYKVEVVTPGGRPPLMLEKQNKVIKLDVHTHMNDSFLLSVKVGAIYNFKLEVSRLNRNIIPPPSNFIGKPILKPGTVKLEWDPVNGVALSGYEVQFRKSDSSTAHSVFVIVGQTSVIIDRLEGSEYTFTVQAVSPTSRSLSFKTQPLVLQTYSIPGMPTTIKVSASSLTEVLVAWQPPINTGGLPILRYYLTFGNDAVTVVSSRSLSHTFAQLDPDSSYILTIQAENDLGRGAETAQRVIIPRQVYEQTRSLPLEIIIPSIIGGLLIIIAFGMAVVFYTAIRKRKKRINLSSGADQKRRTIEVDLSQSTEDISPGNHGDHVTPVRGSHTFNSRTTSAVAAVNLRPTASFNVPRRNVIVQLPQNETMTTNATYLRTSQLNGFSVSRDSVDYDTIVPSSSPPPAPVARPRHLLTCQQLPPPPPPPPPPLPSSHFKGVVSRTLSMESLSDSSCSSYEDLNPATLDQLEPGYTRLHRQKHVYDSLRIPTNLTGSALGRSIDNISSKSSSSGDSILGEQLVEVGRKKASTSPRKQNVNIVHDQTHNPKSLPRSDVCSVAAYSYEQPLPVKKRLLVPPPPPPRP